MLIILGVGLVFLGANVCPFCLSMEKAEGQPTGAPAADGTQRIDDSMPAGSMTPGVPGYAAREGIFYDPGNSPWIELSKAQALESKAGNIDKYLMTAGLSGLNATHIYSKEHADIQIKETKPTFHLCGSLESKDAIIVQLTRRQDSRSIQTNSGEASSDNRMGYRRSDLFRVSLSAEPSGCISAKADLELKPGEYLLSVGSSPSAYDFGIAEKSP
jgi:hypothetical protein